jgi:peptidoglycan hydrolase-like protein with peptidoglycan-binding domain
MRMIISTISAVVVSTSLAAAATTQPSQPNAAGNAAAPAQTAIQNNTQMTPAHKSAAASKIHAMSRRRVEELQTALNNKDGAKLAIDGVYGPKTRAALEEFQKKNDLKPTGRADQATLRKLQPQHWS